MIKLDLLFSDETFGHPSLGWLPRGEYPDDEDLQFERYLRKKGYTNVSVRDGKVSATLPNAE